MGKLDEAVAEFRESIRLNSDFAQAHYELGTILEDQGKSEEADAEYAEAKRLKPDIDKEP